MDKGKPLYQVDARKKGTNGKRESFIDLEAAEKRASELDESIVMEGIEGMAIRAELRIMALQAEKRLSAYDKTILDAVTFYIEHLKAEEKKAKTLTVEIMADKWLLDKENDKNKPIKERTLQGIKESINILKRAFGKLRLADITEEIVNDYLNGLKAGNIRKDNIRRLIGQFFNWCILKKHYDVNPAKNIEIYLPSKDIIEILEISKTQEIFKKLEEEKSFNELIPFHSICIFAGLRPTEAELLTWENINIEAREITVLRDTTKVKETRIVKIENTLFHWLNEYRGNKKGFILNPVNRRKRLTKFRIALGYKYTDGTTKEFINPSGVGWVSDIMRHTFASYWLGKYKDRAHLAEQMGNSLAVIKKNYRKAVSNTETEEFWNILPADIRKAGKAKLERTKSKRKSGRK